MWPMHTEFFGWGWIWMLIFWGSIIALIVWGVRRLTVDRSPLAHRSSPLDIAKERYARGEISREEFEQIKRDLS